MYQVFLSSFSLPSCKFMPTCSCYAHESISKYGVIKGCCLTLFRIIKCHPFSAGGYDPVPNTKYLNFIRGYNDK